MWAGTAHGERCHPGHLGLRKQADPLVRAWCVRVFLPRASEGTTFCPPHSSASWISVFFFFKPPTFFMLVQQGPAYPTCRWSLCFVVVVVVLFCGGLSGSCSRCALSGPSSFGLARFALVVPDGTSGSPRGFGRRKTGRANCGVIG